MAPGPPDHGKRCARLCLPPCQGPPAFPELFPEYEPHQVREVYLIQWEQPSLLVDITDTMEVKLKAIACHVSQVGDLEGVEAGMRARAAALGKAKGHMYAEGFDHVLLPG